MIFSRLATASRISSSAAARGSHFQFLSRLTPENVRASKGDLVRLSIERHDIRIMEKSERRYTQLLWAKSTSTPVSEVEEPKNRVLRASRQVLKKLREDSASKSKASNTSNNEAASNSDVPL
ncbi:putative mitochondrial protein [Andalucia godoyi]|uniref:Putative mitochondrial protein n=1 Tax=Andalucia godoyi TaxID=505711 RepID=A0A8K0F4B3_ANDGO|nr:putative mitochondrial protein [Andalucia godoyi]|eukprot:ANDGO_01031.mRNA.1 putative mitochondrial protein